MSAKPDIRHEWVVNYCRKGSMWPRMTQPLGEDEALETAEAFRDDLGWEAEVLTRTITTTPWKVVRPPAHPAEAITPAGNTAPVLRRQ